MYIMSLSAIFLILFCVSAGVVTQVRTANKPPQLFDSDSNLQRLYDLAANLSDSGISCDQCSGIYKVKFRSEKSHFVIIHQICMLK